MLLACATEQIIRAMKIIYLKEIEFNTIKKNPKNNEIRFELARNLIVQKQFKEAIESLLYIVENKKDWNQGAAKKELLELFSLLGNNNKFTMEGRAKLSNLIFK